MLPAALVLVVEQLFQFELQIASAAIWFRGGEGIHGWAVKVSEGVEHLRRRGRVIEAIGFRAAGKILLWNPHVSERLAHGGFVAPGHRADEAVRGWRRIGTADGIIDEVAARVK
jgi:hypothetical protein